MLEALACRGPDSAGVALFGPPAPGAYRVRLKTDEGNGSAATGSQIAAVAGGFGASGVAQDGVYLRCTIPQETDANDFLTAVEAVAEGIEVVSLGRQLEIVKQVGSPQRLEQTFGVSAFQGSHGLGHTRLSTESIVDISHSQPFWSHGYPDLAIVHNGHITNYHQLRRQYEQKGVRFYTENDSEIIAIYLAGKLRTGLDLRTSLNGMLSDLDGSFSCLASTDSEFGFVKDPFSFKPLLFAETGTFVAVATEEIAIRNAISGRFPVREAQGREVRVWQR